jgi:hypothetical protein
MNLLVLFAYSTSARYEIGNEELTVSPWPAMAIVTGYNWTKVSVGWSTWPARLGGWHLLVRIPSCCLVIPLEFSLVVGSLS